VLVLAVFSCSTKYLLVGRFCGAVAHLQNIFADVLDFLFNNWSGYVGAESVLTPFVVGLLC
jgi:hypothetical protein